MNHRAESLSSQGNSELIPDSFFMQLVSLGWLLLFIAGIHFIVEIMVMSFLSDFDQVHPMIKAVMDTMLLLCALTFGLYIAYYLPTRSYYLRHGKRPVHINKYAQDGLLHGSLLNDQIDEKTLSILSPKRLVPLMVASIFIAELGVMLTLAMLPSMSAPVEALIDATGLLVILSPTFYFFHYLPLQRHDQDRKKIIDRLTASEERLQLALQAVNDSLWDYDLRSGEVYASPRAAKVLGFKPGEIEPNIEFWRSLLHPEEREQVIRLQEDHLAGKNNYYMVEHRLKCKNDNWIWVLARGQVVSWDEKKQPLRMIGTYTDITQRKEAEEAVRQSEIEIRSLSHKLLHTSEEDKKRLAQDLHDEFGQVLTAFQLGVEMLRDHQYDSEESYQFHCDRQLQLISRMEKDLRIICDQLRPVMLDDVGLEETLRWHIQQFSMLDKSIDVDYQVIGAQPLSRELDIVLYRICQEALNNVAKHAGAKRVKIELELAPEQASLIIQDDGKGLDETLLRNRNQYSWGLGLIGMRERAAAVGGRLKVESGKRRGTLIRAELPLRHAEGTLNVN